MKENVVKQKTKQFAIRITNLYKHLTDEKKEFVLSKQILRCGTSVGANIEEAIGGQSDKDFLSKLSVSYKETRETIYWLNLLLATNYLLPEQAKSILQDADEICKILAKIKITITNKTSLNS